MKIIRRLEEFDKLENGMGLKVFIDNNDKTLSVGVPWKLNVINRISLSEVDSEIIALIKAMGFEFEWKPKRTLEEVLHSYSTMFFVPNEKNYLILEKDGRYSVSYSFCKSIGTSYYLKKDAEKICDELNS